MTPRVGRYVRVTTAARVDVIGQVVRISGHVAAVRVPNWCADGFPMEWMVRFDELEPSTKAAAVAAARNR